MIVQRSAPAVILKWIEKRRRLAYCRDKVLLSRGNLDLFQFAASPELNDPALLDTLQAGHLSPSKRSSRDCSEGSVPSHWLGSYGFGLPESPQPCLSSSVTAGTRVLVKGPYGGRSEGDLFVRALHRGWPGWDWWWYPNHNPVRVEHLWSLFRTFGQGTARVS